MEREMRRDERDDAAEKTLQAESEETTSTATRRRIIQVFFVFGFTAKRTVPLQ
jgi:hypothetical protein